MDDGSRIITGAVICGVTLLASGALSVCRTAAVELSDQKLRAMAETDKRAARILALTERPAATLAAFSLLRTLCTIILTITSANFFHAPLSDGLSALLGSGHEMLADVITGFALVLLILILSVSLGVMLPKKIGENVSEETALRCGGAVRLVNAVFFPIAIIVRGLSLGIAAVFGMNKGHAEAVTEEEILMMVDAGNEVGVIEESQRDMINNIFEFGDLTVGEVMTHRTGICAVQDGDKISDVVYLAINEGVSRIPVYSDTIDNITGIIYVKDLLCLVGSENTDDFRLSDFMREVIYVPETCKCDDLFARFTREKSQFAVAVDEYGGTAGIVTMEDLLESIVGNIQDEYDNEAEEFTAVSDGVYTIDGMAEPEETLEKLGLTLPDGKDYDTMGGFIVDLLGRIPEDGETPTVSYKNVDFTVLLTEDRRISRIKAVVKPAEEADEKE